MSEAEASVDRPDLGSVALVARRGVRVTMGERPASVSAHPAGKSSA